MSATKSLSSFLCLVVLLSHELTNNVDAVPMANHPRKINATKLSTTLRPPNKSTSRNARFFGKFSFLAGLGLPDAVPLPIKREDLLYERVPTRFSASYNFPPVRWGPYFAAVYEPTPMFVHNPLSYIAAALNPFNWFAGTGTTSSTGRPETTTSVLTTSLPIAVSNQQDGDLVVLLQEPENEIPNEDRISINDKMEMQAEKEFYTDKTTKIMSTDGPETTSTFSDTSTVIADNEDINMDDLIAEETTLNLNRGMSQRISDESRQTNQKTTTKKKAATTQKATTKVTAATTNATKANTTTTTTTEPTTLAEDTTTESVPTTTEIQTTEANENTTETLLPPTIPSSTNPPTNRPNFYPGYYYNGYYYGGQPQNISNVEFTTQQPDIITSAPVPVRFQGFNNGNPFGQQYQPNYDNYDQSQPQSFFDYYSRYDQYPTDSKDFLGKPLDFLNNGANTIDQLNGFKPSFPYYH